MNRRPSWPRSSLLHLAMFPRPHERTRSVLRMGGRRRDLGLALLLTGCGAPPLPSPAAVEIQPTPPATSAAPAVRRAPDRRVRQVSTGVYEVEATLFDELLDAPARHAPRVRATAEEEDGKVTGYRLDGITPGSLLAQLGLDDGDVIEIVNGENLRGEEAAAAVRASARRTAQVVLVLRRNGFPKLMVYRLVYYLRPRAGPLPRLVALVQHLLPFSLHPLPHLEVDPQQRVVRVACSGTTRARRGDGGEVTSRDAHAPRSPDVRHPCRRL